MKNKLFLFIVLIIGVIGLMGLGCATNTTETTEKNTEKDAEQITKDFINKLYTLNSKEATEGLQNISSSQEKFRTIMTEDAINSFTANRSYIGIMDYDSNNKCSTKLQEISLSKRFDDKNEKKIGYDYTVKVETTYDSDGRKEVDVEKGYVGLAQEKNEWKIYATQINNLDLLQKLQIK